MKKLSTGFLVIGCSFFSKGGARAKVNAEGSSPGMCRGSDSHSLTPATLYLSRAPGASRRFENRSRCWKNGLAPDPEDTLIAAGNLGTLLFWQQRPADVPPFFERVAQTEQGPPG